MKQNPDYSVDVSLGFVRPTRRPGQFRNGRREPLRVALDERSAADIDRAEVAKCHHAEDGVVEGKGHAVGTPQLDTLAGEFLKARLKTLPKLIGELLFANEASVGTRFIARSRAGIGKIGDRT